MPLIDYIREDGTVFTHLHKMGEPLLTKCPTTEQSVKRQWSGKTRGGVIYKTDGFYQTDYK